MTLTKKLLTVIFSLSMLTVPVSDFPHAFGQSSSPFLDVNTGSLEGKAAAELYRMAIIQGVSDGQFKGSRLVNRAEAAKFLLLAKGTDLFDATQNPFSDVSATDWYSKYVLKASALGIIAGYSDGSFHPSSNVTTAEFLKMLSITFSLETNLPYSYQDAKNYPGAWFWTYAGAAQKYGLFPHRSARLSPMRPMTRNEVAVAIYEYFNNRDAIKTPTTTPPVESSTTNIPTPPLPVETATSVPLGPIITTDGIASANSTVNILESHVSAYLENFTISAMTLNFNNAPGFGFSSVNQVNIVAGGKIVSSVPPAAVMNISGLTIPAARDKLTYFIIQLVLGNVGTTGGSSGEKVALTIVSTTALNSNGTPVLSSGFPLSSNTISVYANTVVLTANPLPIPNLTASTDQTIADFTAATNGAGRAGWDSLSLTINKSSRAGAIGASGCYVKKVSDSSSSIPGVCTVASTDPLHASANTIPDLASSGTLTFTATDEQTLPTAGERYQIHLITNGAPGAGESLGVSFSHSPAGTAPAPGTTVAAAVANGASFVWSDESAGPHSLTSNDWYNDFGVQNLPLLYSLNN